LNVALWEYCTLLILAHPYAATTLQQLTSWKCVLLEIFVVALLVNKLLSFQSFFKKPKGSLPCSQKPPNIHKLISVVKRKENNGT